MLSPAGLARISARRPWWVVVLWVVLLVLAGVAATGLGDAFTTEGDFTNKPESVRADTLLQDRLRMSEEDHASETVIVRADGATVDDQAVQQLVTQLAADLRAMPDVIADVVTYYDAVAAGDPTGAGLVSDDRPRAGGVRADVPGPLPLRRWLSSESARVAVTANPLAGTSTLTSWM